MQLTTPKKFTYYPAHTATYFVWCGQRYGATSK